MLSSPSSCVLRALLTAATVLLLCASSAPWVAGQQLLQADLSDPQSVAVDSSGSVFVADETASRIVQFNAAGALVAFRSIPQSSGVSAVALQPSSGLLYAGGSDQLYIFAAAGVDGSGGALLSIINLTALTDGSLQQSIYVSSLAISSSGTVYVADGGNERFLVLTAEGELDSSFDPAPSAAYYPFAVALDGSGLLFVLARECERGFITVASNGSVLSVQCSLGFEFYTEAIAVDNAGARVYLAGYSYSNNSPLVLSFTPSGTAVSSFGVNNTATDVPCVTISPAGRLYACDSDSSSVLEWDAVSGAQLQVFNSSRTVELRYPQRLAADSRGIVVATESGLVRVDNSDHLLLRFNTSDDFYGIALDPTGTLLYALGYEQLLTFNTTSGQLVSSADLAVDYCEGIALAVDSFGLLWVACNYPSFMVLRLQPPALTQLQSLTVSDHAFADEYCESLATDHSGNVIVAYSSGRVFNWSSSGTVLGIAYLGELTNPGAVAVDSAGDVLVVDNSGGGGRLVRLSNALQTAGQLLFDDIAELAGQYGEQYVPALAVEPSGNILLALEDVDAVLLLDANTTFTAFTLPSPSLLQFQFCLSTAPLYTGGPVPQYYSTLASGLLTINVSQTLLHPSAGYYYVVGVLSGTIITNASSTPVPLRLLPVGTASSQSNAENDNAVAQFSFEQYASTVTLSSGGLALTSSYASLVLSTGGSVSQPNVRCINGSCTSGQYGSLQLLAYVAGGATLSCQAPAITRFFLCLITGSLSGQQVTGSALSISTGVLSATPSALGWVAVGLDSGWMLLLADDVGVQLTLAPQSPGTGSDNFFSSDYSNQAYTPSVPHGLTLQSQYNTLRLVEDAVYCSSAACGSGGSLYLTPYNATGAAPPCLPAQPAQFAFCLITGTAVSGDQSLATFTTVSSGVINTTSATASDYGSYTAAALTGTQYTSSNPTPVPVSLATAGSLRGYNDEPYYLNDNDFSLSGSSLASTDNDGLGLVSSYGSFVLWSQSVTCTAGTCGTYGKLLVTALSPGQDAASALPCSPTQSPLQLQFCLITGDVQGPQTQQSFSTVSSGVVNLTVAALPTENGNYAVTVTAGRIVSGSSYSSSQLSPVPLSLAEPNTVPSYYSSYLNDNNLIVTDAYGSIGPSSASLDSYGIGLNVSNKLLSVSSQGLYENGVRVSGYYSLQVALSNSSSAPLPCVLAQPAQFAFCLITGTAVSGDQSLATFTTVSSGVINTTSATASDYGSYTAAALTGTQYTSSNPTPVPVSLAAADSLYGYYDESYYLNDNQFSLSDGSTASTDNDGLGLVSSYGSFVLWSSLDVTCTTGTCGTYGKLTVRPITAGQQTSSLPCAPGHIAQLQFCLITGSVSGQQTELSFSTVTSAVVNLTTTVEDLAEWAEDGDYSSKTVTIASIVSGSSYNSSSGVAAQVSLAAPETVRSQYGYSDNVIVLQYSDDGVLQGTLDYDGLGLNVSNRLLSVSVEGLYENGVRVSGYYSLQVALFNSSSAPLPCALAQPAQFAFCLITGTAVSGDQSLATFTTVSSGVINTTSATASDYGSYTAAALTGTQYTSSNPTPVPVSLATAGSLRGYNDEPYYLNDNDFSLSGSSLASTDNDGLGLVSSYGSFVLWSQSVTCTAGTCGTYGKLLVTALSPGQDAASALPCSPTQSPLQLQFCLITGDVQGPQTQQSFSTVSSGVVNLTVAALPTENGNYAVTVTAGRIVSGSSYSSSQLSPVPLSLAEPNTVPSYYSSYLNDNNLIVTDAYGSIGPSSASLDSYGIGLNVSNKLLSVSSQGLYENGVRVSGYYSLQVALSNSSSAPLPCVLAQPAQFAFCLITGTAVSGDQSLATFTTVSSGVINTTSATASDYGSYTAAALTGTQYTSSNPTPVPVSLATAGSLRGYNDEPYYLNDNDFSLSGSSLASTDNDGLGLVSSYGSFVLWSQSVTCTAGTCGTYGKLFVQLITAEQPNTLRCAPTASVAQLQVCLITGSIAGSETQQTEQTFSTVTSAIVNLTISPQQLIDLQDEDDYSTRAVSVASIVSGSTYNSTSGVLFSLSLAAPSTVQSGYGLNRNAIDLHFGDYYDDGQYKASLDDYGIGLNVSNQLLSVSAYGLYENGKSVSPYYSLQVAPYNSTSTPLRCAPAQPVQFAFCLITGSASTGAQTLDTYATVSYGILNTTSSSFAAYGTYTVDGLLTGFTYTANSTTPQPMQLAPASTLEGGTYSYYYYDYNDNEFTLETSGAAYTDADGLGLSSAYGSFDLWEDRVTCSAGSVCGQYGSMLVQRYNASLGSTLPCAPQGTALQFSFCLQTGSSSTGQQTAESWSRIVSGRFNSTATLLQANTQTTVGAIVGGSSITSTDSTPVAVQLAAPGSLRALYTATNDNGFTVPSGVKTAPQATLTDANGIGFVTADGAQFVIYYADYTSASNPLNVLQVACTSGVCGQWASLTVQLYDDNGTLACSPPTDAQVQAFSFCLHDRHGSQCTADVLPRSAPSPRASGTRPERSRRSNKYVVSALLTASQTLTSGSTSSAAASVALLPPSSQVSNAAGGDSVVIDNLFTFNADGRNSTQVDSYGIGFTSSLATFALFQGEVYEGGRYISYGPPSVVQCQSGACGRFGQLTVAPYTAGGAMVACQPLADVLQLSICSIVGTSDLGSQTVDTYTAVTYGVVNTTSPATSTLPVDQLLTIGAVVSAFQYTSTDTAPVNVSLAPVGSVSRYAGNEGNDNAVYTGYSTDSSVATLDYAGLALQSSYATLLLDAQGAYFALTGVSQYSLLQVQLYNASTPALRCSPSSNVIQFSFCLQTGSSSSQQTSASFTMVLSGILNTTSPVISTSGVYQVAAVVDGLLYTRTQLSPVSVQVAPTGSVAGYDDFFFGYNNDNEFDASSGNGAGQAAVDWRGLAFQSDSATFNLYNSYAFDGYYTFTTVGQVNCVKGSCHSGDFGLLRVQLYNSSNPQPLDCSVAQALNLSSSSSSSGSAASQPSSSTAAAFSSSSQSLPSLSSSSSSALVVIPPSYEFSAYQLGIAPFSGRLYARFTQQSLYVNAYAPILYLIGGQSPQGLTLPLTQAIWVSTDGGVSWSPVGSNLTLSSIPTLLGAGTAQLANGALCIFGGVLGNGSAISTVVCTRDAFATSPLLYQAPFSSRYDMAYTVIPSTNMLLFCAGITTTTANASTALVPSNDCWLATQPELGASSWQQRTAAGPFPAALNNAAMVSLYDNSSTLLLCGGAVNGQALAECWVSQTLAVNWSTSITAAWGARSGLVIVSDLDGWAYLYGGQDSAGDWYYDLWVSTDQAQSWFRVVLPGAVIEIQGASLAFSYTVYDVGGVVGTYKQVILVGGVDALTGQPVTGTTAAVITFPSIPGQLSAPLPGFPISSSVLLSSQCQFTINVPGTVAGFGLSSYSGNPLLTASVIAGLAGAVLGLPASDVQVCIHMQYGYPGFDADSVFVLLPNISINASSAVLGNLTAVIANGTNTTVTSQPGTLPVSPPVSSSSSSSSSASLPGSSSSSSPLLSSASSLSSQPITSSSSSTAATAVSSSSSSVSPPQPSSSSAQSLSSSSSVPAVSSSSSGSIGSSSSTLPPSASSSSAAVPPSSSSLPLPPPSSSSVASVSASSSGVVVGSSSSSSSSTGGAAHIVGDPSFVGLRGQRFQVHGIAGAVYSLISDRLLQLNSRFVFLSHAPGCPVLPSTGLRSAGCWSHPGSYLAEIGLKTSAGSRLHVVAGSAAVGFGRVTLDGLELSAGSSVPLSSPTAGSVRLLNRYELSVECGDYALELENIDGFVNVRQVAVLPGRWSRLASHGLLGQTWRSERYKGGIKDIQGEVDDYAEKDGDLFGDGFVFNQFRLDSRAEATEAELE